MEVLVILLLPVLILFFAMLVRSSWAGRDDTRWSKGDAGELVVDNVLRFELEADTYRVISNLMLPAKGGTTQIDHVVVSRYGLFVVETKNCKGWIFGGEHQATWTKKVYKASYRFQNPLHQNYKHIKTIAELTGIPEHYFKSLIVFLRDATFKTGMPTCVTHPDGIVYFIRSHVKPIILDEQIPEIVSALMEWAGTVTEEMRESHAIRLQVQHAPVSADSAAPACPKCARTMVLRTKRATLEKFWGCPGYPNCKGTRAVG